MEQDLHTLKDDMIAFVEGHGMRMEQDLHTLKDDIVASLKAMACAVFNAFVNDDEVHSAPFQKLQSVSKSTSCYGAKLSSEITNLGVTSALTLPQRFSPGTFSAFP